MNYFLNSTRLLLSTLVTGIMTIFFLVNSNYTYAAIIFMACVLYFIIYLKIRKYGENDFKKKFYEHKLLWHILIGYLLISILAFVADKTSTFQLNNIYQQILAAIGIIIFTLLNYHVFFKGK